MGRRKRSKELGEQIPLVLPELDQAKIETPVIPSILKESLRGAAASWAQEAGFKSPIEVIGPERVEYCQHGYGYVVRIQESGKLTGRPRLGTATFTFDGRPAMWTVDGIVTG